MCIDIYMFIYTLLYYTSSSAVLGLGVGHAMAPKSRPTPNPRTPPPKGPQARPETSAAKLSLVCSTIKCEPHEQDAAKQDTLHYSLV